MCRTAAAEASRLRLAMSTCHPWRASWRAHSKPMPEFPPVIRTTSRFIEPLGSVPSPHTFPFRGAQAVSLRSRGWLGRAPYLPQQLRDLLGRADPPEGNVEGL